MRVLVVGGSGYLGRELVRLAAVGGHHATATFHTRELADVGVRLDVRDRDAAVALVAGLRPDLVVNAAYVQADWVTTADGAAHVALGAAAAGARLVHVSSDVVFSGRDVTYPETAAPDPVNPYGAAKAAAETAVRAIVPSAVVARTSLILGDGDSVQERRVHDLASGRRDGVLFTDDVRCPVHVVDLAAALLELGLGTRSGVHHVAGPDPVSRHEIGLLVAERDGLDATRLTTGLRADTDLTGPLDVRLDCAATHAALRTRLRGAREFLVRR